MSGGHLPLTMGAPGRKGEKKREKSVALGRKKGSASIWERGGEEFRE